MVSDDTEHACMVAQALIRSQGVPKRFATSLAWRLRWWLLTIPAGVGWATLRSILKLWAGFPPSRSGVWSAGNGPAMRSAIIGVVVEDQEQLRELVSVSSRLTHSDPRAEYGAMAVAVAAHLAARFPECDGTTYLDQVSAALDVPDAAELLTLLNEAVASAERHEDTVSFACSIGLENGVSGFVLHTVPAAIHAWLMHPHDLRAAVTDVIRCGGDTDSTAAIVGGIVGSSIGEAGIPADLRKGLLEWPRSVAWMAELGASAQQALTGEADRRPLGPPIIASLPRNVAFLLLVLAHGFRRLLPPY
jgi:ADP-ribosyl-[dinitrogen reductase] hydrolase